MKKTTACLWLMLAASTASASDIEYGARIGLSVNHFSDTYEDENGQDIRYNEDNDHFAL